MTYAKRLAAPFLSIGLLSSCIAAYADDKSSVFYSNFDNESSKWALMYGAEIEAGQAHSADKSIKIENEASLRSKTMVAEAGTMEIWLRTSTPVTNYKIKVLVNTSLSNDSGWV